jgi:hypothetical protein
MNEPNEPELNVVEWNMNGRGDSELGQSLDTEKVLRFTVNHILACPRPDVICLTEYVQGSLHDKIAEFLTICGYDCVLGDQTYNNSVLLAINLNGILKDYKVTSKKKVLKLDLTESEEVLPKPNFCEIQLSKGDQKLVIIGIRIRTSENKETLRCKQFQALNAYLEANHGCAKANQNTKIICMGDFNQFKASITRYKLLDFFNQNEIFPRFKEDPPDQDWSFVFKPPSKVQLDLIAVKNSVAEKTNDKWYDWSFVSDLNGYGNKNSCDDKSDLTGLPDHAILRATVTYSW